MSDSETHQPEGHPGPATPAPSPETDERHESGVPDSLQFPAIPRPPKEKLQWGFAVLGFVVAIAMTAGIPALAAVIGDLISWEAGYSVIAAAALMLEIGVVAVMIVALVRGRNAGDNRLRSFGIGGLMAYAAWMLLSLLLVGACFVSLGNGTLLGN